MKFPLSVPILFGVMASLNIDLEHFIKEEAEKLLCNHRFTEGHTIQKTDSPYLQFVMANCMMCGSTVPIQVIHYGIGIDYKIWKEFDNEI